jgi:hypothetical protein
VQPASGAGEVAFFGDGNKVLKLAKFHGAISQRDA